MIRTLESFHLLGYKSTLDEYACTSNCNLISTKCFQWNIAHRSATNEKLLSSFYTVSCSWVDASFFAWLTQFIFIILSLHGCAPFSAFSQSPSLYWLAEREEKGAKCIVERCLIVHHFLWRHGLCRKPSILVTAAFCLPFINSLTFRIKTATLVPRRAVKNDTTRTSYLRARNLTHGARQEEGKQ